MNVAFLNENTLGHTSYLPRFVGQLERHPELGIRPFLLDVLPLPADLQRWGEGSIRGLRKVGLDFNATRWRMAVSRHARRQLDALRASDSVDAVVVNTQSVGLDLAGLPGDLPVFVGLDATFTQLARSPWFAINRVAGWLLPITIGGLIRRERALYRQTRRFLPWSERAAGSLRQDYGVTAGQISVLPPSFVVPPRREPRPAGARPQALFLGGDFVRKGGPLVRAVHQQHFADRYDLHVITQSAVEPGRHLFVHHGVTAGSEAWWRRWREADLFVFPSRLETFGIVLLEALAFEVPVIASNAGAAEEIVGRGAYGTILPELTESALTAAWEAASRTPEVGKERAQAGRRSFEDRFDLTRNTAALADWLRRERA